MTQLRIPAVYMRGGTSKGVFFVAGDLPADPVERDAILLRVIGSPDHYGKHRGDFVLDGVTFPAAEIALEFLDLSGDEEDGGPMFPTASPLDRLVVPGIGSVEATLINAGNPTVFVDASVLGLRGTELQADVNANPALLALAETLRAHGAVAMGLATSAADATARRPATPKLAFVARPAPYVASDGKAIDGGAIDLLARIFSMGPLHHAMTGTGAVAIAAAAAVPGTLVHRLCGNADRTRIRFGHPSGTLTVGAEVARQHDGWVVTKAMLSRSARRLMEGWVRVPVPH